MSAVGAARGNPAATLTIGDVLAHLKAEFPDLTISKIRFLEDQGLVRPERTPSGYRKFSESDVERLRYVLTMQRDHYLPLRVIGEHLEAIDRGLEPPPIESVVPTVPKVALAADGSVLWSVGDVESPVLPRSCNKPVQALGMVRLGLDLPPDLLALACASHSGEPFHVEGVRRILAGAGLTEEALQTPPDYPLDDAAREVLIRGGGERALSEMPLSG